MGQRRHSHPLRTSTQANSHPKRRANTATQADTPTDTPANEYAKNHAATRADGLTRRSVVVVSSHQGTSGQTTVNMNSSEPIHSILTA